MVTGLIPVLRVMESQCKKKCTMYFAQESCRSCMTGACGVDSIHLQVGLQEQERNPNINPTVENNKSKRLNITRTVYLI